MCKYVLNLPHKKTERLKSHYHTKGLLLIKGQESFVSDYFVNLSLLYLPLFSIFSPYQFKILLCEYENEGQLLFAGQLQISV